MWLFSKDPLKKKSRMVRHVRRQFGSFFSSSEAATTSSEKESTTAAVGPVKTTTPSSTAAVVTTRETVTSATSSTIPTTSARLTITTSSTSTSLTTSSTTSSTTTTSSSSTTSTSTTSGTTSSTTSTSSSTTSKAIVTTPTTSATRTAIATTVTSTFSSSRVISSTTLTSAAASSTASSDPNSSVNTSSIVGIAAGSIIGAVVLIGVIMFFVRRRNRDDDDFDPDAFRRQSMVLQDEAPLRRGNSGNVAPRPPTMFERKNMPGYGASMAGGYGSMNPSQSGSPFNDYPAPQPMVSYSPGMFVPPQSPAPVMQYANAAPFFSPAYQSPMGSPVTIGSYGGAQFDAQGQLIRAPSGATTLSRNTSVAHPQYPGSPPLPETADFSQGYGQISRNPSIAASTMLSRNNTLLQAQMPGQGLQPSDADYADLNRASVTPFQAAQYEAISKQLNIPPPVPLHQVNENDELDITENSNTNTNKVPQAPLPSPFDDPTKFQTQGTTGASTNEEYYVEGETASTRVTSMPPSLPEISMSERVFSPVGLNFPSSSSEIPGRASPKVDLPPLSPISSTPQKAQVVQAADHDGRETPVEIGFAAPASAKIEVSHMPVQPSQPSKRPETVYDDDDAYGGF